jgi:hypothetical protein
MSPVGRGERERPLSGAGVEIDRHDAERRAALTIARVGMRVVGLHATARRVDDRVGDQSAEAAVAAAKGG